MAFCIQADLERALGGAAVLAQLLDPQFSGSADATSVQDILDEGSLELASYIEPTIDTSALTAPYPRLLVLKSADVCAYHAYTRGGKRQAVPQNIQTVYDAAIRWATDVGQRRAGIGSRPRPPLNEPAELVDPSSGTAIPPGAGDFEMNGQEEGPFLTVGAFRRSGFR